LDRKYRQHGYQDRGDEKPSQGKPSPAPRSKDNTYGPRPLNMPSARTVSRCTQCGVVLRMIEDMSKCPQCGFELHSCKQCVYFDPSAKFECRQPVAERVVRKDRKNLCTFYSIKTSVERETSTSNGSSAASAPRTGRPSTADEARRAFEDLFKK
jgi:predicted RNA-binding Zn-ribbon protein involved in translation (DUF1610 family)